MVAYRLLTNDLPYVNEVGEIQNEEDMFKTYDNIMMITKDKIEKHLKSYGVSPNGIDFI